MNQNEKRMLELDALKGIAILGVVTIHVVGSSLFTLPYLSHGFNIALIVDQLSRISVPIFVAASGYTLSLKYIDRNVDIGDFFRRRLFRILPWYFFWAFVIYLFFKSTHWVTSLNSDPMWKLLVYGRMDYHLYFVPMIFQLYLLFPFILWLFKRFRLKFLALLFILEAVFYYFLSQKAQGLFDPTAKISDQQEYLFFGTWVFYFVLGITLRFLPSFSSKKAAFIKVLSLIFLYGGLFWMLTDSFSLIYKHFDVNVASRSTRIPVLLYTTGFVSAAVIWGDKVKLLSSKVVRIFAQIGRRSYITYLCHSIVLRIYMDHISPYSIKNTLFLILLTLITADAIAQVCEAALKFIQGRGASSGWLRRGRSSTT
ncbi:MAG TPA: acyltransferase [Candidatus Saccharimonadales bacterium]|nr:acyltransferase [Candidatus Saccharimonadales bacterium]